MRNQRGAKIWWRASLVASLLVATVGGGTMLFEGVPAAAWSLGLNMLVVGVLGLLVSALGAWLTRNSPGDNPGHNLSSSAEVPRVVFVVRPERRELFESLRVLLAGDRDVDVILDRRERPRDAFDQEVRRRGWAVARVGV